MNNYIPVLQDPVFLAGLGLVGIGFAVLVASALFGSRPLGDLAQGGAALRVGLQSALLAALVALAALAATYWGMPARMSGRVYYELLFWGGGHVLQFTHTLLMLVAWLWLAAACGVTLRIAPRLVAALFALGALPVLAAPLVYVFYAVDDPGHVTAFTDLMKYGNALAALPLGLLVVLAVIRAPRAVLLRGPEGTALLFSMLLFAAGGVIGYLISGINVTIPAHYHGSIVAVTIAFMGVTYHLLPRLGFAAPMPRLARLQPAIYGGGQLLHVLGLAWSGGYGVQRKTAGAEQGLDSLAEIAGMAVMGIGGLIAVIGGLLFLVVAIKAIWWKSRSA